MNYNCIIVGSGLAGLNCALHAANHGSVLIISKNRLQNSNSWLAQGGIAAATSKTDSPQRHIKDTLIAGSYHNDKKAVEFIVKSAPGIIHELLALGTPFNRTPKGELALKREGGHGTHRIVHYRDYTGRKVAETLIKKVLRNKNITILENAFAAELLVKNRVCYGVRTIYGNRFRDFFGSNVVLATGGLGQIYSKTTNPVTATGDGIALAYKAGCRMKDLEFIQFHPTALKKGGNPLFLLSETLRGHGAKLINKKGERFMVGRHPLAELAPRDILSRVMFEEEKKGPVFLDLRGIKNLKKDFPTIYRKLVSLNINPAKDPVPATAAAHYSCGGIATDLKGRTNVQRLFAAGEVACTGLHGANRLASNSLLEAVVMGKQVGENLEKPLKTMPNFPPTKPQLQKHAKSKSATTKSSNPDVTAKAISKIRTIMWKNIGIVRNKKIVQEAVKDIAAIQKRLPSPDSKTSIHAHLLAQTALLVAKSAAARKRSLGCHFIE
jgi:L-aspartate oxidase